MLLNKRIPVFYILNTIRVEIFYVFIIGVVVFIITHHLKYIIPDMPLNIPTFLGTGISVLLSFKLAQSYDRWWEARKIWGSIVNDSRNLVVLLQSFLPKGHHHEIKAIAYRQMAWCHCLGQSLRELDTMECANAFLTPADVQAITEHKNQPLAILQLNSMHIAALKERGLLDTFTHVQLQQIQVNLVNYMGMAERIKNTVFPSTYRYFLHLIIYLFVITLSVALRNIQSYFEIPLLVTLSAAFFLLEKTATFLQDPFSNFPTDTPVTAIATTIETNLKQLIGENNLPEPARSNGIYVM